MKFIQIFECEIWFHLNTEIEALARQTGFVGCVQAHSNSQNLCRIFQVCIFKVELNLQIKEKSSFEFQFL